MTFIQQDLNQIYKQVNFTTINNLYTTVIENNLCSYTSKDILVIILTQYITGFFLFLALWLASYFYPIFTVKQLLSRGVDYNDQFPTIQQNQNNIKSNNAPIGIRTADSSPYNQPSPPLMKTTEGYPLAINEDNQWSTSRPLSPRADPLSPRSHRSATDAYELHNIPITNSSKVKGSSGKGGGDGGYKNKAHAIKRSMIVPSSDELPV